MTSAENHVIAAVMILTLGASMTDVTPPKGSKQQTTCTTWDMLVATS